MSINRSDFAKSCVEQALHLGVNAHYLIAVAQLRSGISEGTDGDLIGPFRLRQVDWNAYCSDTEFDFHFLPGDISAWDAQCPVFALMVHRTVDTFVLKNNRSPSACELYVAQWPDASQSNVSSDLQAALDNTASLVGPAAAIVLNDPNPPDLTIPDANAQPSQPPAGQVQLSSVPVARRPMAQKILNAFAAAGLGIYQQVTALANAIAESALDPNAHAAIGEDSWGLFQLNRNGGLGQGHNPDELRDPDRNIAIVLAEAEKYAEFTHADSLERATSAFVRNVERPRDIAGEIANRLKIALRLLPSAPAQSAGASTGTAAQPAQNIPGGAADGGGGQAGPQIKTNQVINGFDCAHYPGDDIMNWLYAHGGFRVTGLYLTHWPNKPDYSWIAKRSFLAAKGWGFFPTYVGLQVGTPGLATQAANHAAEAISLMQTAGFGAGSVIYLDLESGDVPSGDYARYIEQWIAVVKAANYTPGLYCSHNLINWAVPRTPFIWSFRVPAGTKGKTYDPTNLPPAAIDLKCIGTQYRQDIKLSGLTIPPEVDDGLDLDLCSCPDPSHLPSSVHALGEVS